jgi:hypothetical protein
MVMKEASGGDSLSGRVLGRAFGPSRSRVDDGSGLQYVFWKIDRVLRVFSSRRIYRRKSDIKRWTRAHTMPQRGQGWPTPWGVWPPSAPPSLLWTLSRVEKIGTSASVLSNSENISCVTFLKYKNSRKQGTSTVASR